jgi:hypothetical protein
MTGKSSNPKRPHADANTSLPSEGSGKKDADTASIPQTETKLPEAVSTLDAISNKPNVKFTEVPIAPELLDPTLPTTKAPSLQGEWVGQCFWGPYRNDCDRKRVFVNNDKTCPPGFLYAPYSARTNDNDSNGDIGVWAATCIYQGQLTPEQTANPAKFALKGALYGLCAGYNDRNNNCDKSTVWPMNYNRTCPAGFQFVHTSARYDGQNGWWTGACMLNADSQRPAPKFPNTLSSLCTYNSGERNGCSRGAYGPTATSRMVCAEGFTATPFAARYLSDDNTWGSSCLKN